MGGEGEMCMQIRRNNLRHRVWLRKSHSRRIAGYILHKKLEGTLQTEDPPSNKTEMTPFILTLQDLASAASVAQVGHHRQSPQASMRLDETEAENLHTARTSSPLVSELGESLAVRRAAHRPRCQGDQWADREQIFHVRRQTDQTGESCFREGQAM